jgi:hypothetical protein
MIRHATSQVIALADAARGTEFATDLRDAMGIAAKNGWTFVQAGDYACRLIFRSDSSPKDLIDASRPPIGPTPVRPLSDEERREAAEEARRLLDERAAARAQVAEAQPDAEAS